MIDLVMCQSCGTFVQAVKTDESIDVLCSACPECRGTRFACTDSGTTIIVD